jgi:hypothetical protein
MIRVGVALLRIGFGDFSLRTLDREADFAFASAVV